MKMKRKNDGEILAKAAETARAFADLCAALDRRLDRIMDMDDAPPENDRLQSAVRAGLLTEQQSAIRDGIRCLDLAHGYFQPGDTLDALSSEADHVAGCVATAAERLAAVIGALAEEITDADADLAARALRRARRAA